MNTGTLHDGRVVSTTSEEWRAECEARTVLSWKLRQRKAYLQGRPDDYGKAKDGVLQQRGQEAVTQLEKLMEKLWAHDRAKQLAQLPEDSQREELDGVRKRSGLYLHGLVVEALQRLAANDNEPKGE